MYRWLRFWGSCLRWAFWRWQREGFWFTSAVSLLAVLLGFLGIGGVVTAVWTSNATLFTLMAPIGVLTVGIAPYFRWNDQKKRADDLEERAKPQLDITGNPKEEHYVDPTGSFGSAWGIRVRNTGRNKAQGCRAQLSEIEFSTRFESQSLGRWPERPLDWPGYGETATIPGRDSRMLHVLRVHPDSTPLQKTITIAYADMPLKERKPLSLHPDRPVLMRLSLTTVGSQPIYVILRIDTEVIADLTLRAYSKDRVPVSIMDVSTGERPLSDYQSKVS